MLQERLRGIQTRALPEGSSPPPARPHLILTRRPGASAATLRLLDGAGFAWLRFGLDVVMLAVAVVGAIVGAGAAGVPLQDQDVLLLYPPLAILVLYARGMYRDRMKVDVLDGVMSVVGAVSVSAMILLAAVVLLDPGTHAAPLIARAWLFAIFDVGGGRILLAITQRHARRSQLIARPVLIVGAGYVGSHVARRLEDHPEYGLHPIGFVDADPVHPIGDRTLPVLGGPDDLERIAQETHAAHVILAFSSAADRGLVPLVRRCDELGLSVSLVPRLYESITDRMALDHLGGLPLLGLRTVDPKGWQFAIKYAADRVIAVLGLLLLSPLLLGVAVAVKLTSPGAVLFRQRRVGRDGQTFDLLKFRSMSVAAQEADGFLPPRGAAPGGVEGDDRRTSIGRWLRRTAIDELPQLINVARGEMSLVGPRPERPEFVELFRHDIDRYSDRHRVKSGITGWAQANGLRGQTSLADRVEWDNFYIENWSLWLDFKIALMTVVAVLQTNE
jgi:exopolysaccharide biosynthesis polyprenyl glycosylphosphotransferase